MRRAVRGTISALEEAENRANFLRKSILETASANPTLIAELDSLQARMRGYRTLLNGDTTVSSRNEPVSPSIRQRVEDIVGNQWNTMSAPTTAERDAYRIAGRTFAPLLADLQNLIRSDLANLENKLEAVGASWTPGRVPDWSME